MLLTRDVILVTNYVLWFVEPRRRTISVMLIIMFFFFAHCYALPYRDSLDNIVDTVSLICIGYTAFIWHYNYRFQLADAEVDGRIRYVFISFGLLCTCG